MEAERSFLAELGGDCTLPAGAHATVAAGDRRVEITIQGVLAGADLRHLQRHTEIGTVDAEPGRVLARTLRKALEAARKSLERVSIVGSTIPHEIIGRHGSARVLLKPASPGTGVIAGGGVRAVIEAAGYKDILSKSLGSDNTLNVLLATMDGLRRLKNVRQVAADRGKEVADVMPFWSRK